VRAAPAAALAALVLTAVACGPVADEAAELPLRDDFSGRCEWANASNDAATLGCADGRYRVLVKRPERPVAAHRAIEAAGALRLRASAAFEEGPPLLTGNERAVYGVGCWTGINGDGYVFLLSPAGQALIGRVKREQPGFETLAETDEALAEPVVPGEPVSLRADCLAPEGEPGRLVLAVDDRIVLAAEDPGRPSSFRDVGVYVGTTSDATEISFDDFSAEELTGDALIGAVGQEEPVIEPGERPRVLLSDDFDDRGSGWPDGRAKPGTFGYSGGTYRIRLDLDGTVRRGLIVTGNASRSLEVRAELARAGRPATAGIGCYATPERGYLFVAEPDGRYAILAEDVDGKFVSIARSETPAATPPRVLEAACTGSRDGPTRLELRVDGEAVVATSVPGGLSAFRGPALVARSATGDSEVRFDDVVVRRP
jgi:hypothetical protein